MPNDPLLQPYQLKHLTLRNRIIVTAHEPAYPEDGMPKERYRAYTVERARGGVAMTMTAGSAAVSKDSPPVFNNLLAYRDEIVPWIREMTDAVHEEGAAIMIQLTHLGRRTRWDKGDWLPVVAPSHHREAAHRAFPKKIEDWDIDRIIKDFADAAERMKAGGMDGVELEAYGHLIDQFASPLTNELDGPYGGSLDNRMRFCFDVLKAIRARVGDEFILGVRYTADECLPGGTDKAEGLEISKRLKESGLIDYLNIIRGHIDTDPGLTDVIPIQGMANSPHLDFAGEIRAATNFPTFHAAKIPDVATARHAIASGKVDMVGMTRAHMTDPHIVRKIIEKREEDIRPCVGANYCLDRIYQGGRRLLHPQCCDRTGADDAAQHRKGALSQESGRRRDRTGWSRGGTRGGGAWPRGDCVRGGERSGRPGPPDCAEPAPAGNDQHHRLAHEPVRETWRHLPFQHMGGSGGHSGGKS